MIERATKLLREPTLWVPWILALLPALWMTSFVLQGSHLQYSDYWDMVPRSVTESGGLDFGGLFTFQNEHPVVVPQLLYWANIHLASGSNIALGVVVVAITFAQVVLIGLFVEREDRRTWAAAAVIVVASALLFSRHGVHNFSKSMSGAAWLTANLLVIGAILARWKDHAWIAAALGVVASFTYGTGLVVWPVLVIVGMLRDRRWLPDWRILIVAVFPIVHWLIRRPPPGVFTPSRRSVVENALALGSSVFSNTTSVMRVATTVGLIIGIALAVFAVWKRMDSAIPWIGLFLYGGACIVMISRSRLLQLSDEVAGPSRYASLAALFWIGLFGLTTAVVRWRPVMLVPAAALVLVSVTYDTPAVQEQRDLWLKQDDLSAALVLGLTNDSAYTFPFRGPLTVGPMLDELDHYPFDGSYDGDCGLLGKTYDPESIPVAETGGVESVRRMTGSDGIRIIARLPDDTETPIDCVVVGDADDTVVGIGTAGLGGQRSFVGMTTGAADPTRLAAIAPLGSTQYRLLLVLEDGSLMQLDAPIAAADIKVP